VEYSISKQEDISSSKLYGLVHLNRNSESGISSAYFGNNKKLHPNYLHSMYLNHQWIYNISSHRYDINDADIISDSLHSPVLINPALLLQIEADSLEIRNQSLDKRTMQYVFDLKDQAEQLLLVWDSEDEKILEIEYIYELNTEGTYSRKWAFDYLAKSEYTQLESEYKHQNQTASQPYL
jgi:hypothetical protein